MTEPETLDGTPVTDDPVLHEELKRIWADMDSPTFTEYAKSRGLTPPDDREGWGIAYEWGPNGEDIGLVWGEPSYPDE